ncbi:hypothetical protein EJB05_13727, partial [Eragrostis curvula]
MKRLVLAVLLFSLLAGADARQGAQSCRAERLAARIAVFCAAGMASRPCCDAVLAPVGRPCLCQVAAQPLLASVNMSSARIGELQASCSGGLRVHHPMPQACHLQAVDIKSCLCNVINERNLITSEFSTSQILLMYNECGGIRRLNDDLRNEEVEKGDSDSCRSLPNGWLLQNLRANIATLVIVVAIFVLVTAAVGWLAYKFLMLRQLMNAQRLDMAANIREYVLSATRELNILGPRRAALPPLEDRQNTSHAAMFRSLSLPTIGWRRTHTQADRDRPASSKVLNC